MNRLLTERNRTSVRKGSEGVAEKRVALKRRLVVVGNGMVGHRLLDAMDRDGTLSQFDVTVFGAEPRPAMDRVNLTRFLYGAAAESLELADVHWYRHKGVKLHSDDPVVLVDRADKLVHSQSGYSVPYDALVFATGSRAFRPEIPGANLEGVFVYRNLGDLEQIKRRAAECGSVAVIGGGLLGLEAAEAFKHLGLETHVLERGSGLMARQLNPEGAAVLQQQIEKAGIVVHNGKSTASIEARGDSLEVQFHSGPPLVVGMVVFAAGIRPRDELARGCGLELGPRGGIKVDDSLCTSDRSVFAVGECASHRGIVYGLVLPGYEMAAVLASRLAGGSRRFAQMDQSAILKLDAIEVAAVGEYQADSSSHVVQQEGVYRRIYVRNGRLVGAIGVGDWPEQARIREAIKRRRRIWPWEVRRFETQGRVWRPVEARDVASWPAAAEVCNCMGVTKGALLAACGSGCTTVETVAERTGASTVCGSCRPLVAQIVGAPATAITPIQARPALLVASVLAGILVLCFLLLEVPFAQTVQGGWKLETLWTSSFLKQVTGFTLVGLAVLSMVLSLRKRIRRFRFGNFGHWRAIHSLLGLLTLLLLVSHTGMHLGHNLNFILTMNFLALALFGGLAGAITALEARLNGAGVACLRKTWTLAHIALVWPLPVLILFHALASYYY